MESRQEEMSKLDDGPASGAMSPEKPMDARWWAVIVVIAVPLLTISLYLLLGRPIGVDETQRKAEAAAPQITQTQIENMVTSLAKKLESKPDDAEGWAMLGRSYGALRRFDEARAAYARAVELVPNNSELLTEYADVLAMTNGRNVTGEPEKIILRALEINPKNVKALALAGTAAFQRKDYSAAIAWWKKILPLIPADAPIAQSVKANISQAEGMSGRPVVSGKQVK